MKALALQPEGHAHIAVLVGSGRFAEAWQVFETGTDPWFATAEAGLLGALAAARTSRYGEAWRLVTAATEALPEEADCETRLRARLLSGGIAMECGELEEAELAFQAAVELARESGEDLAMARAWNNLGIVTHLRRHPLLAIRFLRDALRVVQPLGEALEEARIRHNLALVLREHGELDRAEREVAPAVALADATPDLALRALVRLGRAELSLVCGRPAAARADLEAARALGREAHDRHGEAEALRVEALLAVVERRFAPARTHAREGRRLASQIGARLLVAECTALEALALCGLWKPDEAEVEFEEAVREAEAFGAPRLAARFRVQWAGRLKS